eukprot:1994152-Rhodomonas_salina.1
MQTLKFGKHVPACQPLKITAGTGQPLVRSSEALNASRASTIEEMQNPLDRRGMQHPRVDTIISAPVRRSRVAVRKFYNSWLTFWPPLFCRMILLLDDLRSANL